MTRSWLWLGVAGVVLVLFTLPSLGLGGGQALWLLLLLLCPALHLFGGHGGHGHSGHGHSGHGDGGHDHGAGGPAARPARRLPGPDDENA